MISVFAAYKPTGFIYPMVVGNILMYNFGRDARQTRRDYNDYKQQ